MSVMCTGRVSWQVIALSQFALGSKKWSHVGLGPYPYPYPVPYPYPYRIRTQHVPVPIPLYPFPPYLKPTPSDRPRPPTAKHPARPPTYLARHTLIRPPPPPPTAHTLIRPPTARHTPSSRPTLIPHLPLTPSSATPLSRPPTPTPHPAHTLIRPPYRPHPHPAHTLTPHLPGTRHTPHPAHPHHRPPTAHTLIPPIFVSRYKFQSRDKCQLPLRMTENSPERPKNYWRYARAYKH
nr:extensin-like [Penaeus vannamei]